METPVFVGFLFDYGGGTEGNQLQICRPARFWMESATERR
jgi:hypothetical protein